MSTNTISLKVIGEQTMCCGGCERTVKLTLSQLLGVQQVEASHKTQQINLIFDPQMLNLEQIRQELDRLGYLVTPK